MCMKITNNKNIFSVSCLLLSVIFGLCILALPSVSVYAQGAQSTQSVCEANGGIELDNGDCLKDGSLSHTLARANTSLSIVGLLVNTLITIVIALAFFYFFWNLVKYIRDEEGKDEAKTKMGYSLGAIFVIVTLWGIVSFMRNVLGIKNESAAPTINLPAVGFSEVNTVNRTVQILQDTITKCETSGPSGGPNRGTRCYAGAHNEIKQKDGVGLGNTFETASGTTGQLTTAQAAAALATTKAKLNEIPAELRN